jgi:hypothetical protein
MEKGHFKCGTWQQEQATRKPVEHGKSLVFFLCLTGIVFLAVAPALLAGTGAAGPYSQIGTIAVPGGLKQFDILWVDTSSDLMYLGDDGAAKGAGAVDVFDVHTDKFLYKIGLGSFQGLFDATHCCNGPTGVLPIPAQREIWAGDGNSTIKVIDMDRNEIVSIINTGGKNRADEMAWDSKDHLLIIGNPSEAAVNFLTVINTDTKLVQGTINYPNSTGLEQPVWDPTAKRFYVPIDGNVSEVDVIDPTQVVGSCTIIAGPACGVTSQILVPPCPGISGMALLPYQRLMLSCGIILNMPSGSIAVSLNSLTGGAITGDEIYYNAGDNQVYWGSAAPFVVDVSVNQTQPSLAPVMAGSHVIAANSNNNHIYLPSSVCGCIEVFAPTADQPAGFTPFTH